MGAEASITEIKNFFQTGDKTRDSISAFKKEWELLPEAERNEIRALVGDALAKS